MFEKKCLDNKGNDVKMVLNSERFEARYGDSNSIRISLYIGECKEEQGFLNFKYNGENGEIRIGEISVKTRRDGYGSLMIKMLEENIEWMNKKINESIVENGQYNPNIITKIWGDMVPYKEKNKGNLSKFYRSLGYDIRQVDKNKIVQEDEVIYANKAYKIEKEIN